MANERKPAKQTRLRPIGAAVGEPTFEQRRRVRDAYRELIDQQHVTHFITFNFGYLINPLNAIDRMKGFCNAVERKALGRSYDKRPLNQRLFVLGFPERGDLNPHWHCVARVPKTHIVALLGDGPHIWEKFATRGQLDISAIRRRDSVKTYCTKRLHNIGADEYVFIHPPNSSANPLKR